MFVSMNSEERKTYRINSRAFIENGYDYTNIAKRYTDYLEKAVERYLKY